MIFDIGKIITTECQVLDVVKTASDSEQNLLLTYFNQHCFNLYNKIPIYRDLIDNKFKTYIDGMGVYFAMKFLGLKNVQKFNASDLNEKIFEYFIASKSRLFFVGGNFAAEEIKYLEKKGLNVCGYQNGYFTIEDEKEILSNIQKLNPDAIIIGMGVPKQEIFAARLNNYMNNKRIICVGNFLEFYIGKVKRIPKLFRNLGFEWLFRLITEPKRLWKRYIIGIPEFILSIFIMKLNCLRNKS